MGVTESRAVRRLRLVLERAAASADHENWLTAAVALQAALERGSGDGTSRATLRAEMLEVCNALRTVPRSPLGRQWGALTAERVMGPLLRDVLDDEVVDAAEVFALAEAGRNRVLLDVLAGCFRGESGRPEEADLVRAATSFAEDDTDSPVHREIRLQSAVRPLLLDQEAMARRSVAVAEVEGLYTGDGERGFAGGAEPVSLTEVQAELRPDDVLIEYVIPFHRSHPASSLAAVVVTPDAAAVVDLPLPQPVPGRGLIGSMATDGRAPLDVSPLGELVVAVRRALHEDDEPRAWGGAQRLHELLVAPLATTGLTQGRRRWIVVPHRQLHVVPWMGLVNQDGRPWLVEHGVLLAPSASVWHELATRRRTQRSALALGNPSLAYAGLQPLPGAVGEVEHLRETWERYGWPVDARTGPAATAKALLTGSAGAGLVHLATHGSPPHVGSGVDQSILLGVAPGVPGAVGVGALRRVDLSSAWLTTLSICDGGVYFVGQGDELLGLVAAVFEAGTTSVVAPQWVLDDDAGRRLMTLFIDALAVNDDPVEALRVAALGLAVEGARLRDWAAFVISGSGRGPRVTDPWA